jgi:hypothetical protein
MLGKAGRTQAATEPFGSPCAASADVSATLATHLTSSIPPLYRTLLDFSIKDFRFNHLYRMTSPGAPALWIEAEHYKVVGACLAAARRRVNVTQQSELASARSLWSLMIGDIRHRQRYRTSGAKPIIPRRQDLAYPRSRIRCSCRPFRRGGSRAPMLEGKPLRSGYTSVSFCPSQTTSGVITPFQRLPGRWAAPSNEMPRGSPQPQHRSEYRFFAVMRNAHTA